MGSLSDASGRKYLGPVGGMPIEQAVPALTVLVQNILQGKLQCVGDVTLTANSATTTLTDDRIGPASYIGFMPKTSNAAAGITALYVSSRSNGSATLTHANNAQTDRQYTYLIIG